MECRISDELKEKAKKIGGNVSACVREQLHKNKNVVSFIEEKMRNYFSRAVTNYHIMN